MMRNTLVTGILFAVLCAFPLPPVEAARLQVAKAFRHSNGEQQMMGSTSFAEAYNHEHDYTNVDYDVEEDDPEQTAGSLADTNTTGKGNCNIEGFGFGDRFTDITYAGSGMSGCVVVAKDAKIGGAMVAIKVPKKAGKTKWQYWNSECRRMRGLHIRACEKGEEALKLAEAYLPTCLEVGNGTDGRPYMVQHAAGGRGMGEKKTKISSAIWELPMEDKASLFAQTIGALTAIHGVDWSHNDLHFENIIILKNTMNVAIIDFGTSNALTEKARKTGSYHEDESLPGRLAPQLAGCQSKSLDSCLKDAWGADDEFLEALSAVRTNAKKKTVPSKVPDLYHTAWVQKHQPPLEKRFSLGECKL